MKKKNYRAPWIYTWPYDDFWPSGLRNGRFVVGPKDSEWSFYLMWLEGY